MVILMASYEAMMTAPAADAVDRGRMTYDDVVVKSPIRWPAPGRAADGSRVASIVRWPACPSAAQTSWLPVRCPTASCSPGLLAH